MAKSSSYNFKFSNGKNWNPSKEVLGNPSNAISMAHKMARKRYGCRLVAALNCGESSFTEGGAYDFV